jgi:hypothetical protein
MLALFALFLLAIAALFVALRDDTVVDAEAPRSKRPSMRDRYTVTQALIGARMPRVDVLPRS